MNYGTSPFSHFTTTSSGSLKSCSILEEKINNSPFESGGFMIVAQDVFDSSHPEGNFEVSKITLNIVMEAGTIDDPIGGDSDGIVYNFSVPKDW